MKIIQHPTYVWLVVGSRTLCDIRRYAYTHREAVGQLKHCHDSPRGFRDAFYPEGIWTLFKLVRVNKRRVSHAP